MTNAWQAVEPAGSTVRALADVDPRMGQAVSLFGLKIENAALAASLREGMAAVEDQLLASAGSAFPAVDERSKYLLRAGGKRLRPLLALLAAQFGDPGRTEVIAAAAACELTHLASLHHDDVMDRATVRRSSPSANAQYGNLAAVLCGDLLFAAAAQLTATLGMAAVDVQARTFRALVVGQTAETEGPDAGQDPLTHYQAVIRDKTGSLTAACGGLGAMAAGCSDSAVRALTRYGELIGLAFQVSDDLLDVAGDEATTGKAPGTDLREGVDTLPVLYIRRSPRPEDGRLLDLLGADLTEPALLAEVLELVKDHPAMLATRRDLQRMVDEAIGCLDDLTAGPARNALILLARLVALRRG